MYASMMLAFVYTAQSQFLQTFESLFVFLLGIHRLALEMEKVWGHLGRVPLADV